LDEPVEIADQLILEQTAIIEQHLPFALDNYDNMIKVVHVLGTDRVSLSIPEIAERGGISRMRVKDAINDLKNAGIINESKRKQYVIRKDLAEAARSQDSSRDVVEKLVASKQDIIDVHVEAAKPKHVAISYDGEPTMYRRIGELIQEFRKREISTFVVTNGTFPERIKELQETDNLPTQLYVTLAAPNKETYVRVCSSVKPFFPVHEEHWERLNLTLSMLSSLKCRTVIRITSVRGVNMINPEEYRKIIQSSGPSFLEVKGFSISGNAPKISERLGETKLGFKDPTLMQRALTYAPTHDEIVRFAKEISISYDLFPLISQSELNRQVLMSVGWNNTQNVAIDFQNEL